MLDTAGTLSMLPRDKNGVVDASLRVYGTRNIRVVDLSIAPLHVAAHTQCKHFDIKQRIKTQQFRVFLATVYAIAEQAADILKAEIASS